MMHGAGSNFDETTAEGTQRGSGAKGNWYDRAITAGIVSLVALTPLAIGSVHPWAYIAMEVAIFALVTVWMVKIRRVLPIRSQPTLAHVGAIVLPLSLFLVFVSFALVPMPPALERAISPATYQLYVRTLPGWPSEPPLHNLVLSHPNLVASRPQDHGAADSGSPRGSIGGGARLANNANLSRPKWRPLSVAPALTGEMVLKLFAYAALFLLVLLYPFGPSPNGEAEKRFYRAVLIAVMVTGFLVASIALLERVFWNGKILWFFVPYDWGGANLAAIDRVRGPFVNPDHFAGYLNFVLPLGIAALLFPTFLVKHRSAEAFRVFGAVLVLIVGTGLLLSLSRSGWMGAVVGSATLITILSLRHTSERPALLRLPRTALVLAGALALVLLVTAASIFVGGVARNQADLRVRETVTQHESLDFRVKIWRDALPMVRDFPLFGIGLGSFTDLFPHYQTPPWSMNSVGRAHNDYLELLLGAGVIGFLLLGWFLVEAGRRILSGLKILPPEVLPVAAALVAGMAAMALEEFFDFDLQIPANALLLVLFLALTLRLVVINRLARSESSVAANSPRLLPPLVSACVLLLATLALFQDKVPYPYNFKPPATLSDARRIILAHPAAIVPRMWLADLLLKGAPLPVRGKELEIAVWLDPTNPYARDLYAQNLVWQDRRQAAMEQIAQSVYAAPALDTHFYLKPRLIPFLAPHEIDAVERGLRRSIAHGFRGAIWSLADLYQARYDYLQESALLARAAQVESIPGPRARLLIAAGLAAARGGAAAQAERELRAAAKIDPANPEPYRALAVEVFAAHKQMAAAKAVIDEGVRNGADPFELNLALADAAENAGDKRALEGALQTAIRSEPSDFGAVWRLASLYQNERRWGKAAIWMRRAAEIRPDSAQVYYSLGLIEEAQYQYYAARREFRRALALDPKNQEMQSHYKAFQAKLRAGAEHIPSMGEP
jgi:putative inorganic carbon (HCO3(-)) transporter